MMQTAVIRSGESVENEVVVVTYGRDVTQNVFDSLLYLLVELCGIEAIWEVVLE